MSKRFKIILMSIIFIICITILYYKWIEYIFHLVHHQGNALLLRQKIEEVYIPTPEKKNKLSLIYTAKDFGKRLYGLKESKSFEYYVDLHRKSLGWNLTISPPLEMKAKEFAFPIVGKFGYLGFLDERLKNQWKNNFLKKGYDVYENEIGAYSTLGYFKDPIFSTYLGFDDNQLISLILHEMVHEKYYVKNDSDFSESMAVFMEKTALNLFLYKQVNPPPYLVEKHKAVMAEYTTFEDLLDETKQNLESLYKSVLPESEKIIRKKNEFDKLRIRLRDNRFKNFTYAKKVSEMPDLNNAFLVQNSRYTPKHNTGFSLLLKDCHNDIACWFDGIKRLEKCDKDRRKIFMSEEIRLESILKKCKP